VGSVWGGGTAEGARRKNTMTTGRRRRRGTLGRHGEGVVKTIRRRQRRRARAREVGDETGLVRFWFRLGQSHVPGALSPIITGDPVAATTHNIRLLSTTTTRWDIVGPANVYNVFDFFVQPSDVITRDNNYLLFISRGTSVGTVLLFTILLYSKIRTCRPASPFSPSAALYAERCSSESKQIFIITSFLSVIIIVFVYRHRRY